MIDIDNITIDELVEILTEASDRYYNEGESDLSDAEFDALEAMLKDMDPLNPFLLATGADERGGKVPLPVVMGSLDQLYEGEVIEWVTKAGLVKEEVVVTAKLDGTSSLPIFSADGNLQIAFSRGNGFEGADITRHLRSMKNVPQQIPSGMMIRGEVILPKSKWADVCDKMEELTGRRYKNARNFVAGMMNKKVAPDIFYETVDLVVYEILHPENLDKSEQIKILTEAGFKVAQSLTLPASKLDDPTLQKMIEHWKTFDYELDGVVIDVNNAAVRKKMPARAGSKNPGFAKKYKVGAVDNVAVSKVVDVHWKASKHGYLKPRVEIEPIDLVGVTITFATGFNASFIYQNKIGPGALIEIVRSGDVIPYITRVISPMPLENMKYDEWFYNQFKEFGEYEWSENEVDLVMLNGSDDVEFEKLKYFFGKLSVEHAGEGNIRKMFDAGYRTPAACVIRGEGEWKKQVGDSAGSKIYNSLRTRLNPVKPEVLAAASGLFERGIGERKLAPIIKKFGTLDIPMAQLMTVEGIQDRTAMKIVEGYPAFKKFQDEIAGFFAYAEKKEKVTSGKLVGDYVVFTGIRDKELEAAMEAQGAEIGSSMGKCTLLVAKDPSSNSGKAQKAREAGVKIVSHAEAKDLVV